MQGCGACQENVELTRVDRSTLLPEEFAEFFFSSLFLLCYRRQRRGIERSFLKRRSKREGFCLSLSLPVSFAPEKRVVDSRRLFSISPSLVEGKGWRPRSCHARFKCINNERPVSGTRDTIGSGARRIFSSRTRATACTETVN